MIDLRSDTLTQPTDAMREAMANASVGDDMYGEDPAVNQLERRVAELLGKEEALFTPSGTMSNQIGVRLHCQPGDEFLCEAQCHIFHYEQAAYAQLFGVATRPVTTPDGQLTIGLLEPVLRGEDIHYPRTRLLCLENTHNRHGGRILSQQAVVEACDWARRHGLACHLDGARLWNAAVARGHSLAELAEPFDTVSVCFSKGLGAPVGSAIVGSAEHIAFARRVRKAMGGAMRQAGVIASAALFAIDHQLDRLAEDHANAQLLADAIRETPHLRLVDDRCDTNIVLFEVDPEYGSNTEFCESLVLRGVGMFTMGATRVRAVTHLGVSREQAEQAAAALRGAVAAGVSEPA
ncbi:MAG: GntG family PLP-dependent aldolase [Planctomycetota bacterium]